MNTHHASRRSFLRKSVAASAAALLIQPTLSAANSLLSNETPFEGYNPFSEEKNDLRELLSLEKTVKVSGVIYGKDGKTPASHTQLEVWHLSPGSSKYRHRGKLIADANGRYTFLTDFPNRTEGLKPRIYFKASDKQKNTKFTELIFDTHDAYISKDHWEAHQVMGDKIFPNFKTNAIETAIEFNFTVY